MKASKYRGLALKVKEIISRYEQQEATMDDRDFLIALAALLEGKPCPSDACSCGGYGCKKS